MMGDLLFVPNEIRQHLPEKDLFFEIMQLQGKPYRDVPGRKTIQLSLGDKSYFIKQHFGIGWGEIFKNLLSFKRPVLGAMTEVAAIKMLDQVGIHTTPLIGYGRRGLNPANQQSFLITEDLGDIVSLETLCADWPLVPPSPEFRQKIVIALANLAKNLHAAGMCHRDFYLCHFVMDKRLIAEGEVDLILIDLHRVCFNQASGGSAVMKDIAALIFSGMDCGFTSQDWQLFKQHYLPQSQVFWQKSEMRAKQLYAKFHGKKFQQRLHRERANLKSGASSEK